MNEIEYKVMSEVSFFINNLKGMCGNIIDYHTSG